MGSQRVGHDWATELNLDDLHTLSIFRYITKWSKRDGRLNALEQSENSQEQRLICWWQEGTTGEENSIRERFSDANQPLLWNCQIPHYLLWFFSQLPQSAFLNFGFKSISWAIYTLWYVHQPAQVILWESQQNKWSLVKKQECVFEELCIIKYLPSDIYTNHYIFI